MEFTFENSITLVWKGKIIEDLKTPCEFRDFLCEFECDEIAPFRLRVCSRLFVTRGNKVGDDISIPMGFKMNNRLYETALQNTPLSCFWRK